jgi:hypothetical protein
LEHDLKLRWTCDLVSNLFLSGQLEREKGLNFKGGFGFLDRDKPVDDADFQLGFINFIVRPLYTTLAKIESLKMSECIKQLDQNKVRLTAVADCGMPYLSLYSIPLQRLIFLFLLLPATMLHVSPFLPLLFLCIGRVGSQASTATEGQRKRRWQ